MKYKSLLKFPFIILLCVILSFVNKNNTQYKCLPCGLDCDKKVFNAEGECPTCRMKLVDASSITFKNIEPDEICTYIEAHPKAILLDVRTKEEFEGKADPDFGTLKRAVNIPVQELASRLPELEKYKGSEIIVYCSHSHRSPQAAYLLTQNGFTRVLNMAGGMSVLNSNACKK